MIGAYLSFSVFQACLLGLLCLRAFPSFSLLTKRIPALSQRRRRAREQNLDSSPWGEVR